MSETRTRIVTATNELFRVHGYHATSLSQISEASGATTGSIYHFFPGGKDDLTATVIETTASVYRQLFEAITHEANDPVTAYEDFFHDAAGVLEESDYLDPCPIGTVAREIASSNERLRNVAAAAFESWIAAATSHLVEAGLTDEEARRLAVVFVANVEGGFVLSRTLRRTEPMYAAARTFAPIVASAMARTGSVT